MTQLKFIEIEMELAKTVSKRIEPFLEEYFRSEKLKLKVLEHKVHNPFTLQQLLFSCYLQGLADAKQVIPKL